ncbi:MAG TPA: DUF1800 domain-containing protein [Saprospiraceae bacterium]|nr:DUF1800 domain-containing protein [Saprospiraceae bacterium]
MDRRATLHTLLGKNSDRSTALKPLVPLGSGLEPYTGPWEYEQAAHLLRRTMFGPRHQEIKTAAAAGLQATVNQLFTELALPAPPINYNFENDPHVPIGATWVNAPYTAGVNAIRNYRNLSLRVWTAEQLLFEGVSIREKLTLFWHNHFGVSNISDPKFWYQHITTLRTNAWGNFRDLVKAITIDPAMLRFLNGNQSTRTAPNENYARELMELFTLGKGQAAGPGDYTTFTEQDVAAMARVLTGWRDRGYNTNNPDVAVESYFQANRHDTGNKQLSHRFDNQIITNKGEDEYAYLVDVIFERPEVARFISRKLYRWFVYYVIDETTEQAVIAPMAQLLEAHDFEIRPVLEALLSSAHFYHILNQGPMIKNPIDFVLSAFRPTAVSLPDNPTQRFQALRDLLRLTIPMQMEYFNPPDVAGWKAYYQAPAYYRTWISAATLPPRMRYTDTLSTNGYRFGNFYMRANVLEMVKFSDNPYDPVRIVRDWARLLLPQALSESQTAALKEILVPGLPDYVWGVEYTNYEAAPNNNALRNAVETKLRTLLRAMLSMAEFYLS